MHYFYLNRPAWGFLYLFTLGLLGIGWLVDLFRMPCLVSEANKIIEEQQCLTVVNVQQALGQNQITPFMGNAFIISPHMQGMIIHPNATLFSKTIKIWLYTI